MFKWLHHLLNPHCEHCRIEKEEESIRVTASIACQTCAILRFELEKAQRTNELLLARLLDKPVEPVTVTSSEEYKPILPRTTQSWRVRQAEMESESRRLASELLQKKNQELEKEVLGEEQENAS